MTVLRRAVHRVTKRLDRRAVLMQDVMAQLDIDTDGACTTDVGLEMWGAMRSCAFCGSARRCAMWLTNEADPYGYRAFCPNAGILDHLPRR